MRLSTFIRDNEEAIILGWQDFAKTYVPAAEDMDRTALRDHIIGLLKFIADDLETPETERERSDKAKGQGSKGGEKHGGAAATHGDLRFNAGFDTVEMISEFRALRASVIKLWRAEWTQNDDVLPDLLRFNEAIDQIMTESLLRFGKNSKDSGSQIIELLVKDVCEPLQEISVSVKRLLGTAAPNVKKNQTLEDMTSAISRINSVILEVIDTIKTPRYK